MLWDMNESQLDPSEQSSGLTAAFPLPQRFFEREASWLSFNTRVLQMASQQHRPLLERVRYCSIVAANLDEFFMVRVAGLKRRVNAGIAVKSPTGRQPREILSETLTLSWELMRKQAELFNFDLRPKLTANGIELLRWDELSESEHQELIEFFDQQVFPVLTPLAVDPAHPFPYISGLSLNLAVMVRNPQTNQEMFARVKVPPLLERLIQVSPQRFVSLEDVIAANLHELFPGMEIVQHHTFRVTRNEDVEVEEDDAENLLDAMEKELSRRRFGYAVRLEVAENIDQHILDLLIEELEITPEDIVRLPAPLDLRALELIAALNRDELKDPAFQPRTSPELALVETSAAVDVFEAVKNHDVLLHHPYDSFATSVTRFIEQAAEDPKVLAIKQALYRTSGDSAIVEALIDAAAAGKQVLAVVEIKARFDEENNIQWARRMERAGVHVVYGQVGLKTHCKLTLVVRKEEDGIKRYVHIGTGNYHPRTARYYEDIGLITANPTIADDVAMLFNQLSGFANSAQFESFYVAPNALRPALADLIKREIANHLAGKPAGIRIKCNAIVDERITDLLYQASQAGVKIELLVRGMCTLRPGLPGLSENITVKSILGRFLEHSRIYEFTNAGDAEILIGSADLMNRNLDRRVEVLLKVPTPAHRKRLSELLDLGLANSTAAWQLDADGNWSFPSAADHSKFVDYQEELISRYHLRGGR
jgi:polyphosphate kinase